MPSTLEVDKITSTSGTSYLNAGTLDNVTLGSSVTGNNTLPSMGAWVKLESTTASGEADITMGSASLFSSTYRVYKIIGSSIKVSNDNVAPHIRISRDGSLETGSLYDHGGTRTRDGSATTDERAPSDSAWSSCWGWQMGGHAGSANERQNFELTLYDPSSTTSEHWMTCIAIGAYYSDHTNFITTGGRYRAVGDAIDGVNFYLSAGTITSGYFNLYGVA